MKKPGTAPDLLLRDWVPIEVHDWGYAGYWPCPRLAPRRLTGIRLRRLIDRGALWFCVGKLAGLIAAACGLGGPHYATIALQSPRANFRSGLIGYATLAVIGLNR